MKTADDLFQKLALVLPFLDERARRLVAAGEAKSLGFGGISKVSRASGLSRKAISKGIDELDSGENIILAVRFIKTFTIEVDLV